MAKKVIRLTEQDVERLVKKIIKEDNVKDDLLIKAYNLMSDMGFGDDEIEELGEEFNDDLGNVYNFLKREVSNHYSDELFDRYEALLSEIEPYVDTYNYVPHNKHNVDDISKSGFDFNTNIDFEI